MIIRPWHLIGGLAFEAFSLPKKAHRLPGFRFIIPNIYNEPSQGIATAFRNVHLQLCAMHIWCATGEMRAEHLFSNAK